MEGSLKEIKLVKFIKHNRFKDNWFFIPFCALGESKGMVI